MLKKATPEEFRTAGVKKTGMQKLLRSEVRSFMEHRTQQKDSSGTAPSASSSSE
ncbi:hypothetical protein LTR16_003937, partial [Cryomyces antarcticus]